MTSTDLSTTIHSLPDELLLAITRVASLQPLRICAVCSRWRQIGITSKLASREALEVSFTDHEVIPMIADHFPRLSSTNIVDVCLPLSQMLALSQCTPVLNYHYCEGSCQHDEAFDEEIDRIVSALPTLRVLKADHHYGLRFDMETEVAVTGYFHLFEALVILSSTIEVFGVLGDPTVWPSIRQLETLSHPRLTELWLAGRFVVPHVCQDENNPSPIDCVNSVLQLLQLLVTAPNLIVLNLQLWYLVPSVTAPSDYSVIDLACLEEVYFREVHEVFVKRIFAAIRAPRLRILTLADTVRDEDTAYERGEVMNAWNFPCFEVFILSSLADDSIGDLTFPALALGRMLRDGHLQRLEVSSPGWVTELHLRDAIDAIHDPSVTPSLLILQVSNSSPPVQVDWVKGAERERNALLGSRRLYITLLSGYASHKHDEDRRIGGENDVAPETEGDSADLDIE